ncbi:MAG: 3-dehydroquinate synthase [Planctomycetota bacterium]|jgi:3-dehydroquinate synthase
MMPIPRTVRVELGERSYDVRVGAGLLDGLGSAVAACGNVGQVVIVSDSTVTDLYGKRAGESLEAAGLRTALIHFPAGEANKNLATMKRIYDRLFAIAPAIDRNCIIVALGGGVPGDVAGFVAATALRGLRFFQCPTTLLADVDASVGGKTGVDHETGKNLIGAFHQPQGVLIDVETLRTLPSRELRSGLAECVKHTVIRDATLLDFIESNAEKLLECQSEPLIELIARNVAIKAAVVAADERESGVRAHLNFGHTVGHAIEAALGYGTISHGQGVALGMIAAARIAEGKSLVDASLRERLERVLERLGLATRVKNLDADAIWRIMQHDKKAAAGRPRFVLPVELGKVDIFDDVSEQEVRDAVEKLAPE